MFIAYVAMKHFNWQEKSKPAIQLREHLYNFLTVNWFAQRKKKILIFDEYLITLVNSRI